MVILLITVNIVLQFYTILIIASAVLSYFMSPFDPIRQTVDRFVNPLLNPIRKIIPSGGMFDFSPLVLLIILQVLGSVLSSLINSMR